MTHALGRSHLEAWRRFYPSFWRIFAAIDADLETAGLPSLAWYDALYQLYLAPERRLRMSELAKGAQLSKSGMTRLVDKLEKGGLLVRKACAADGRVQYAELTSKGVDSLRKIWPAYRDGIARYFAANLTDSDARQLAAILGKLVDAGATR